LGVVDNHIDNLYRSKEPEPFIFFPLGKNQYNTLLVKTEQRDLAETQKYLEATWKEIFPGKPFESQFQQDILLNYSKRMNGNMKQIFIFITILGALLSASGIFALASLNVLKRILPLLLSAMFIFGIGIFTTSITILRTARSNPVDSLRTE
jgi:putative ABC transport system permease protein